MKVRKPSAVEAHDTSTMSANAPIVISRNRNAAASLRNGLSIGSCLEEIDRRVHDDPHYVDEVPVDSGKLDAVVVLRRVVTAEAADRHHEEEAQADRHVRPVQPREAEEDRGERAGARVEADVQVLDQLRAEERQTHYEGE